MTNSSTKIRGFEEVATEHKAYPEDVEIKLPLKATKSAGGYDWYTPIDLEIPPQGKVKIVTDIKAYMRDDEILILAPRSSTGIKHDLMLANTIAVGDEDFFGNTGNDGNYCIVLRNLRPEMRLLGMKKIKVPDADVSWASEILTVPQVDDLREENTVHIKAGDRIIQGFFVQTLPADSGDSEVIREGGVGSTGE